MKGYELLYPGADATKNAIYDNLLKLSNQVFDEFTTGKAKDPV
jgi:hypothetical protein